MAPSAQGHSHHLADAGNPPKELSGLAWGAIVCLGAVGILDVVRIGFALHLHSVASGGGDIVGAYRDYSRWAGFALLALLVSAAVFIAWFFRAYKNLRRLGVQELRYGPGWAIGAWFVPILGLFRPKQIANDIWRGGEPGVEVTRQWRQGEVPPLVHWWWALFLGQGLLVEIGGRMTASGYGKLTSFGFGSLSSGLSQIKTGTVIDILGALVGIAGVVAAIKLVSQISRRLDGIREDVLAADPAGPPPQVAIPAAAAPPAPQPPAAAPPLAPPTVGPPTAAAPAMPPQSQWEQRVRCPECAEWIQPQAKVCRFCGHRPAPTRR